jgi:FkbM family methyltransferase
MIRAFLRRAGRRITPERLRLFRLPLRALGRLHGCDVRLHNRRLLVRRGKRAVWIADRHWIYLPDILRSFESYWGSVVPTVIDGVNVVDYSEPRFHTYRATGIGFWLSSIAEEADAIEAYFAHARPQPGDTVFDLGANCGVSTYHLAQLVGPTGRVYAFEPDPANYELLLRNLEQHGLTNVVALNQAVGGEPGSRAFVGEGNLGSGFADILTRPTGAAGPIAVAVTTIPRAVAELGVRRLTFVKMDIEGAELEAITGSLEFLRSHDVDFAIDTNHAIGGDFTHARVEALFRSAGYDAWSARDSGFWTTWARPARPSTDGVQTRA